MVVALIVVGPEQLPAVLRATGKVLRELRSASNQVMRELTEAFDEDSPGRAEPSLPSAPTPLDQRPEPHEKA